MLLQSILQRTGRYSLERPFRCSDTLSHFAIFIYRSIPSNWEVLVVLDMQEFWNKTNFEMTIRMLPLPEGRQFNYLTQSITKFNPTIKYWPLIISNWILNGMLAINHLKLIFWNSILAIDCFVLKIETQCLQLNLLENSNYQWNIWILHITFFSSVKIGNDPLFPELRYATVMTDKSV